MIRLIATQIVTLSLLVGSLCTGGCTTTTRSREDAKNLAIKISAYRIEQSDRVDRINQQYRDRFNQLMDQLVQLSDTLVQQGRDQDAQSLTDSLISDEKSTLIGVLRNSFASTLKNQRAAITSADLSLTSARKAYVSSYTEASLDLKQLDTIQKDLEILGTKETVSDILGNATHIIQNVIETRNQALQQAAVDSGKKPPPAK